MRSLKAVTVAENVGGHVVEPPAPALSLVTQQPQRYVPACPVPEII
jgi:hypothetical protein